MALLEPPLNTSNILTLQCRSCKHWEVLSDAGRQTSMELYGDWGKCNRVNNGTFIESTLDERTELEKVIHFQPFYGAKLLYTKFKFACINFEGKSKK